MFVLQISMPPLKALFFIKKALRLLFLQKHAKFSIAGGSAPRFPNSPPIANFWLSAWGL